MSRVILLDSGVLGMVTHPRKNDEVKGWLRDILRGGAAILVPEIADYEVRRELLRAGQLTGLERLDRLGITLGYLPITTEIMRNAADLWAAARCCGRPTASPDALDADVILAAQALLAETGQDVAIVVTDNVGRLTRFVNARRWQVIR